MARRSDWIPKLKFWAKASWRASFRFFIVIADGLPRAISLLLVAAATLLVFLQVDTITGSNVWHRLFYPSWKTPADVQAWSALVYSIALVLGLPIAYLLWHWRDRNVRDQIENSRKDVNLKEFQEVQLRAAGAFEQDLPLESREQLQIAALHQLRGFLRGEYGESFRHPAVELLLAGHASAVKRVKQAYTDGKIVNTTNLKSNGMKEIKSLFNSVDRNRMSIISDEFINIFNKRYRLHSKIFDFLDFYNKQFPEDLDMHESSFMGCNFYTANLRKSDLRWAQLQGASLSFATMKFANLFEANLCGAILENTNLEGTHLRRVKMDDQTFCKGARFNNTTAFGLSKTFSQWDSNTESEKDVERAVWLAKGAVRIDKLD